MIKTKQNIRVYTEKESDLNKLRKKSAFSKAEEIIAKFLSSNEIEFYTEFFFKELIVSGKPKILFFDFYIPAWELCIEFDGQQHYTRKFNGKPILNGEVNDFVKNAFCKKKGFNLLRIKYTDIENIESIICKKFDELENKKTRIR